MKGQRLRASIGAAAAIALLTSGLTALQAAVAPAPAQAAAVTDFEPGFIISDSIMYDSSTMDGATVQSFLNTKGAGCSPSSANTCIKDYRESTPTRAADALCPGAYAGASNETAAQIIAKAAVACGINPQVLLVTLQKEQGLITASAGKSAATYARALGFGCPDSAGGACDQQYAGFANQVYSAAKQFRRYAANPNSYSYRAGRTNTILWHPNASCGTSQVYIENQATASLYNYTPYRPNDAALAAGYGSGNTCSSYGNRNFHLYFKDWFGSPKQRAPFGSLDSAQAAGTDAVTVAGWALDPDTNDSIGVHVYVDGVAMFAGSANGSRPDVDAVYRRGPNHGFTADFPATSGRHNVCIYAIDSAGGANPLLGCRTVNIAAPPAPANTPPVGTIDLVADAGNQTMRVSGWALDPDTNDPIGVHIYVNGVATFAGSANGSRPDVDAVYHHGPDHGFTASFPATSGRHDVCVYAIDSTGGTNPLLGCRTVTIAAPVTPVNTEPTGFIDSVYADVGSIRASGWALDPDTTDPIGVHLYVDGIATLAFAASVSRPDVDAVYRFGANHGFDVAVPAATGRHSVCLYAIDNRGGTNVLLGCRTVSVP